MNVGDKAVSVTKEITQEKINKYAQASGDFNPLHLDKEFASKTIFKGTIAHGLMSVAFISEMMTNWLGERWVEGGELEIAFLYPVRPGDVITAVGKVVDCISQGADQKIICEVYCENQNGNKVISGKASATIAI